MNVGFSIDRSYILTLLSASYVSALNAKATKPDGVTSFVLNTGVELIRKTYVEMGLAKDKFLLIYDIACVRDGFYYSGAKFVDGAESTSSNFPIALRVPLVRANPSAKIYSLEELKTFI